MDVLEKYKNYLILVAVIVLVIFLWFQMRELIRMLRLPKNVKSRHRIENDEMLEDWNYSDLLNRLGTALEETCYFDCPTRCDLYEEMMGLSDNQLITINNAYKDKYNKTISEARAATWDDGCSWYHGQWGDAIQARLDRLLAKPVEA